MDTGDTTEDRPTEPGDTDMISYLSDAYQGLAEGKVEPQTPRSCKEILNSPLDQSPVQLTFSANKSELKYKVEAAHPFDLDHYQYHLSDDLQCEMNDVQDNVSISSNRTYEAVDGAYFHTGTNFWNNIDRVLGGELPFTTRKLGTSSFSNTHMLAAKREKLEQKMLKQKQMLQEIFAYNPDNMQNKELEEPPKSGRGRLTKAAAVYKFPNFDLMKNISFRALNKVINK